MLTGQNGIMTNAQKANNNNVYYSADEQVKLAYMAVKTQIMTDTVADSSYDATTNAGKLAKLVRNDLNGSDWKVEVVKTVGENTEVTSTTSDADLATLTGTEIKSRKKHTTNYYT